MSNPSGNKIAVLASGFGSNLQALIDAERAGALLGRIVMVLSDREDAQALERAKKNNIQALWLDPSDFSSREAYDAKLLEHVLRARAAWIVLAGYMRILSKAFVGPLKGKIINIHPSLLPKYPGVRAIEKAHAAHERETGVTVHFVDEGVDTGPIILQDKLSIGPEETLEQLTERIHRLEHKLLPEALNRVIQGSGQL